MEQFWLAWYNTPSEGHEQAMVDIWYEHGVDYHSCCVKMTGNTDCSFSDEPDISDVNRLIEFLYLTHAPLCCFEEADVFPLGNPDGEIDISDITRIIDYLYLTHTPLPNCP